MSATITLENIPDDIYVRLKKAAEVHHRSLNGEVLACLERMLLPTDIAPQERVTRARQLRQGLAVNKFDIEEIDRAIDQGRA